MNSRVKSKRSGRPSGQTKTPAPTVAPTPEGSEPSAPPEAPPVLWTDRVRNLSDSGVWWSNLEISEIVRTADRAVWSLKDNVEGKWGMALAAIATGMVGQAVVAKLVVDGRSAASTPCAMLSILVDRPDTGTTESTFVKFDTRTGEAHVTSDAFGHIGAVKMRRPDIEVTIMHVADAGAPVNLRLQIVPCTGPDLQTNDLNAQGSLIVRAVSYQIMSIEAARKLALSF
jgi:hypothetical protein